MHQCKSTASVMSFILLRPRRCVKSKMWRVLTVVAWSVCMSVGHSRELCQRG